MARNDGVRRFIAWAVAAGWAAAAVLGAASAQVPESDRCKCGTRAAGQPPRGGSSVGTRRAREATPPGGVTVAGLLPNAKYEQQVLQLQPGDLLTIFTDGVVEAENASGEQFGEERLAQILIQTKSSKS